MTTLTDRDVAEKWSHIAMKLFPPQMDISVGRENGSWSVYARWKEENGSAAPLTHGTSGVELLFDEKSIKDYLDAGVDDQLKCDRFIEAAINDRLQSYDPLAAAAERTRPEQWVISLGDSVTGDR